MYATSSVFSETSQLFCSGLDIGFRTLHILQGCKSLVADWAELIQLKATTPCLNALEVVAVHAACENHYFAVDFGWLSQPQLLEAYAACLVEGPAILQKHVQQNPTLLCCSGKVDRQELRFVGIGNAALCVLLVMGDELHIQHAGKKAIKIGDISLS